MLDKDIVLCLKLRGVIKDIDILKKVVELQNNKVIDVGIDMKLFNCNITYGKARKYLGITQNEKMIFISRGTGEIYNIDVIIKTIPIVKKYYNDIKYVFCDMRGDFYRKFIDLILDNDCFNNVIIAGQLNHNNQLPYYYTDSNIVISVPSSDSSPFSVYESMACKTPVIISELPWYHKKFQKDIDMVVVRFLIFATTL